MLYYKITDGDYIVTVGSSIGPSFPKIPNSIRIMDSEYFDILTKLSAKPEATDEVDYKLRDDTLEWEVYDKPSPEVTLEDTYSALTKLGVM